MKYNAFISYSHKADHELAGAIQSSLRQLATPWFQLESLTIFRDETNLAVSPELWPTIEKALSESEFFILLASPEAIASKWVRKEVDYWIEHKSVNTLLLALTEGSIEWDETAQDFDWVNSSSVPKRLKSLYRDIPNYASFIEVKSKKIFTLDNPDFQLQIAKIAAPLHKKTVGELIGTQEREFKRKIRLRNTAIGVLSTLLLVVGLLGIWSFIQSSANKNAVEAISKADLDPTIAIEELIKTYKLSRNPSLYKLASDIYSRNATYSLVVKVKNNYFSDFSNGTLVSITRDSVYVLKNKIILKTGLLALSNNTIDRLEISPDGHFFLIREKDNRKILLFNTMFKKINVIKGYDASFSAKTGDVISLNYSGVVMRYVRIYSYAQKKKLFVIKDRSIVTGLDSASYPRIVISANDSVLLLKHMRFSVLSATSGVRFGQIKAYVSDVFSLSASGSTIAIGNDLDIVIYNKKGVELNRVINHTNNVSSLDFSPVVESVLLSSGVDKRATLYNLNDLQYRQELVGHLGTPTCRFDRNGTSFITYDVDNVFYWQVYGVPYKVLTQSDGDLCSVKVSADGQFVAASDNGEGHLYVWTAQGAIISDSILMSSIFAKEKICFDNHSKYLHFVSRDNKKIESISLNEKKRVQLYNNSSDEIGCITMTKDDELLGFTTKGELLRWGKDGKCFKKAIFPYDVMVLSLVVKGDLILLGTAGNQSWIVNLKMLSISSAAAVDSFSFDHDHNNVQRMDMSVDFKYLIACGNSNVIKIFNYAPGKREHLTLRDSIITREDCIMDARFFRRSNSFVTVGDNKNIKLWDTDGRLVSIYKSAAGYIVYSLDISADGKFLATADDKRVQLWNIRPSLSRDFTIKQVHLN